MVFEDLESFSELLVEDAINIFAAFEAHHVSHGLFDVEILTVDSYFFSRDSQLGYLVYECILDEWPKEYRLSYHDYLEKPSDPAKSILPIVDDPLSLVADGVNLKND